MNNIENQNINKRVFLQAKYFFLARLLQVVIVLAVLILFSLKLSKENYGLYQGAWVFINLFAPLIFLGLPQQLLTLPENSVKLHLTWLLEKYAHFYIAVLLILMATLFFAQQKLSPGLAICILICTLLQSVMLLLDNLVIKFNGDKFFLKQNLLYSLLFLGMHIAWLYLNIEVIWLIAAIACISFLKSLSCFLFIRKHKAGGLMQLDDKPYFERQWKQLSVNEIINRVSANADKLVIIFLLSISGFSVYYNGTYEIPFFAMLVSALHNSLSIQLSNNNTGKKNAAEIFKQSIITGSAVAFPLFFFFYCFSAPVFQFFFNGKYMDSVPLFKITMLIAFLRITSFTAVLQVFKKNQSIVWGSILDILVNIAIVVVLYPFLGIKAFPAGFVMGTFCQVAYYIFETKKLLQVKFQELLPIKWLFILTISVAVFFYMLTKALNQFNSLTIIAIAGTITAVIIFILTHYFGNKFYPRQTITSSMPE